MHYPTLTATTTQPDRGRDPWEPYHKKKKPPHPVIPEPATYMGIGLCVLVVLLARVGRRKP